TWGLVVNEAMACGLPIIVSNVAGCSADLVEEGWNGCVVPPQDSEKLSLAIDSVVRDAELRQRMSVHSLERIRNYSPEACADGLAAAAIGTVAGPYEFLETAALGRYRAGLEPGAVSYLFPFAILRQHFLSGRDLGAGGDCCLSLEL